MLPFNVMNTLARGCVSVAAGILGISNGHLYQLSSVPEKCSSSSCWEMEADWACLCSYESEWRELAAKDRSDRDEERWSPWEEVRQGGKEERDVDPGAESPWHLNHPLSSSLWDVDVMSFSLQRRHLFLIKVSNCYIPIFQKRPQTNLRGAAIRL